MKGGFSFCGIDIGEIGLEYAPENKDTYVYKPAAENVHEETFEGHDGGYAYGSSKEPKEFILRCFYEEKHIAKGLMAKVHALFKVGKSGLLIFKRRPWVYYYATVTNVDTDDMRNYLNGLITVTMKAYYPFGRGVEINEKLFSNTRTDPYHDEIMRNTALMDTDSIVPDMSFTNITKQENIILLNPGTERAKVGLVISGHADSVIIHNSTTNQECRYVSFNTGEREFISTDGFSGKTVLDNGIKRELAFLYHDYGFIELEPSFPVKRNIFVSFSGTTVTAPGILFNDSFEQEWYTDKYIYLDNWYKILKCTDKHTIIVYPRDGIVPGTGEIKTTVSLMNEITITPNLPEGASITRLDFIYKPTFA